MSTGPAGMFEAMARAIEDIGRMAKGGTVVVHPQVSKTFEEASLLAGDWKEREKRQVMDNFAAAARRR